MSDEDPLLFPSAGDYFAYMKQYFIDLKMFLSTKRICGRSGKTTSPVKRSNDSPGSTDGLIKGNLSGRTIWLT
jgi:hypothetical protein